MITTHTPDRIDGKDYTGDRWAAHVMPAAEPIGVPPLIAIRTLDGVIHLGPSDAKQLAAWLGKATGSNPNITVHISEPASVHVPVRLPCRHCGH